MASLVGIPSMLLGTIAFTVAMHRDSSWRTVGRVAALLCLGMGLTLFLGGSVGREYRASGLLQRLLFVFLLSWFWLANRHAAKASAATESVA